MLFYILRFDGKLWNRGTIAALRGQPFLVSGPSMGYGSAESDHEQRGI